MRTADEEVAISFRPYLQVLWSARWRIGLGVAAVGVLYGIGAAAMLVLTPSERVAQVEFRLTFDGADRAQYPNGTPFSRSDVVATPVLSEVYRRNELARHLPFETFRDALFVLESNTALEFLGFEYEAKLSDTKMPTVERARIEAEFEEKRDSLSVPQMHLRFILPSSKAVLPVPLMEKILNDILVVWAEQVATQKGSLRYQVNLLTPNIILKDTLNTQTMLIRYDLLRRHVARSLAQMAMIAGLPGASTIRVGEGNFSLTDLRTNLADLLEFQLNPLIRRRLIYALTPGEAALNVLYLEDRVLELQRTRETADARREHLQAALRTFSAESAAKGPAARPGTPDSAGGAMPQLSDSFLDRLIDIAGQSGAMEYRQNLTDRVIAAGEDGLKVDQDIAFYRETLRLLREAMGGARLDALRPEDVTKAFNQIQTRVVETLTLTGQAYDLISSANLNPRNSLYSIVGPFSVRSASTVSVRNLAVGGVATLLLSMVLMGLAAVVKSVFFRTEETPTSDRGAAA